MTAVAGALDREQHGGAEKKRGNTAEAENTVGLKVSTIRKAIPSNIKARPA